MGDADPSESWVSPGPGPTQDPVGPGAFFPGLTQSEKKNRAVRKVIGKRTMKDESA